MTTLQLVVLAIVQGLTEFLPVSSSAHLLLVGKLSGWPDQGLAMDVAMHLGTLVAVLVYFRKDLAGMVRAIICRAPSETARRDRRLALTLLVATVPVLLVGALAYDEVEAWLRDIRVVATTTIVFGFLLWAADRYGRRRMSLAGIRPGQGLAIGMAQALALIPGVSRSGITITMARALGFDAPAAARFAFLLSIPAIAAAGLFGAWHVAAGAAAVPWGDFLLAAMLSAAAGWACIAAFLALLERVGLLPFIVYRLVLGVVLWWIVLQTPG